MGALGGIIDKAVDAATGSSSGTTLQDFLSNFSSADGTFVKTIDPFSTFDVKFRFHPSPFDEDAVKSAGDTTWKQKLDAVGNSLVSSAKGAVKSLVNNATGGLVGAIMNGNASIMENHNNNDDFLPGFDNNHTFMEYLAASNLLVGQEDWVGEKAGQSQSPLELQLGIYCQEITLPNIEVPPVGSSQNAIGDFPINGLFVKTDSNVVTMKIVNTKAALHERIFYPWLRETTLSWWSYSTQPYTTATVTVDFSKHNDVQYVFCGVRPQKIMMQQPNQDTSSANLTRDVSFLFDYMFINSSLKVGESWQDKLLSSGKSLFNSASKMVNF